MNSHKVEKMNSLIKEELSKIIQQEIEFRNGILVSISQVVCPPDLGLAKVWLDVWPTEAGEEVLKILKDHKAILRSELVNEIEVRRAPRLKFFIDKEELEDEKQRNKVEEILEQLKKENKF
ncbi:MAG TPA: 30S ribosome-binding factor RbfA [Patescibacteria group bacterium]|nr:30S ribosome-binding factor RbfA [Patescibacteria group bacterium]